MKCTYLHIIFTQQELRVDTCEKVWTCIAKINSQMPCDITFRMTCTYLHIISTQQELRVDTCRNHMKCTYLHIIFTQQELRVDTYEKVWTCIAKINSQMPCDITFRMTCTYLHIISTQQELRVDTCGKVSTYTAKISYSVRPITPHESYEQSYSLELEKKVSFDHNSPLLYHFIIVSFAIVYHFFNRCCWLSKYIS